MVFTEEDYKFCVKCGKKLDRKRGVVCINCMRPGNLKDKLLKENRMLKGGKWK